MTKILYAPWFLRLAEFFSAFGIHGPGDGHGHFGIF